MRLEIITNKMEYIKKTKIITGESFGELENNMNNFLFEKCRGVDSLLDVINLRTTVGSEFAVMIIYEEEYNE